MRKLRTNIIIVESSYILYQGLKKAIQTSDLLTEIYHTEDLTEVEKILRKTPDSIIITNPSVAQFNSKEFQNLRKFYTDTLWIAFAYQLFDDQLLSLFNSVININDTPEKIGEIIKNLFSSDDTNNNNNEKLLSEREIEVLKHLALGLSSKEIADKLNISVNTATTHRKNISQKTGIKSVSGLTIYAVVNKHITLENTI